MGEGGVRRHQLLRQVPSDPPYSWRRTRMESASSAKRARAQLNHPNIDTIYGIDQQATCSPRMELSKGSRSRRS